MWASFTSAPFANKSNCAALGLAALLVLALPAVGGVGATKSQLINGVPQAELSAAENRLLKRTFARDPLEKRLQRLELLVFGATQFGTETERWQQLEHSLRERKKGESGRRAGSPASGAAINLEEVGLLEKEVLKNSYRSEPITKRLDRLETKVFGQPTASMPAEQRIERLKRTTGLADLPSGPQTAIVPDGEEPGFRPGFPFGGLPGGQAIPGFPEFGQSDPLMRDLLRQMEEQMRGAQRFGNGQINPNMPKNGQYSFRFFYQGPDGKPHYYHSPDGKPDSGPEPKGQGKPTIPGLKVPNTDQIPPYGDPNSI